MSPKHTPVRLPFAGGRAGVWRLIFFWGGGGIKLERAVVPITANCSKKPEVTNAAAGTFLHEGRFAVVRCAIHQGHQCGTNRSCANAACADAAFTRSRGDDYLALSTFHRTGPSSKTTCKIRKLALHPTHHKFWPSPRRQAVEIH